MGDNADTSPRTTRPKATNPAGISSPLVNAVNMSNDTSPMAFPEGTLESSGANG